MDVLPLRILHLLKRLVLRLLKLVVRLLLGGVVVWLVELSVADQRAWHRLGVERLVFGGVLRVLGGWMEGLVLHVLRGHLGAALVVVLFWAVLLYPAIAPRIPRAHSSEWGPVVLALVRAGRELWRMRLVLHVLRGHLRRRVVVVLQKGVEVVLLVLVGGWEMRAGPLQMAVSLCLAVIEAARVTTLTHRGAP